MTTSADRAARSVVLRGGAGQPLQAARLGADLRTSPFASHFGVDPRLVDPSLEVLVAHTVALAEDEARTNGYAAGYATGLRDGRTEAAAQAACDREAREVRAAAESRANAERVAGAAGALEYAAACFEARQAPAADQVQTLAASLAVEIAEALVGHHLEVAGCGARDAVMRALALAPRGEPVTLRLHPQDAIALAESPESLWQRPVSFVADPGVERGGCIADAGACSIDSRLAPTLARLRAVLEA